MQGARVWCHSLQTRTLTSRSGRSRSNAIWSRISGRIMWAQTERWRVEGRRREGRTSGTEGKRGETGACRPILLSCRRQAGCGVGVEGKRNQSKTWGRRMDECVMKWKNGRMMKACTDGWMDACPSVTSAGLDRLFICVQRDKTAASVFFLLSSLLFKPRAGCLCPLLTSQLLLPDTLLKTRQLQEWTRTRACGPRHGAPRACVAVAMVAPGAVSFFSSLNTDGRDTRWPRAQQQQRTLPLFLFLFLFLFLVPCSLFLFYSGASFLRTILLL